MPLHLAFVLVLLAALGALIYLARSNQQRKQHRLLVAYASQTGTANTIATHLQRALSEANQQVQLIELNALSAPLLQNADEILFVVSTQGAGQAPDNGRQFAVTWFNQTPNLRHLKVGVLALGNRRYTCFCAFGLALQQWLERCQAQPLFPAQTVDDFNGEYPTAWREHFAAQGITLHSQATHWQAGTLIAREHLNPGSPGEPLFLLRITTPTALTWQVGDIAVVQVPFNRNTQLRREYSIANSAGHGFLELVVRQLHKPDGELGLGSGWLTHTLPIGATLPLAVRTNHAFHPVPVEQAQILIGSGSGIAGLRGHWQWRTQQAASSTWLLFGERCCRKDNFLNQLLTTAPGHHISRAFSRCEAQPAWVQERLKQESERVLAWLEKGAAVYVCGSQEGMGEGVHQTLIDIAGTDTVNALIADGRYRRDLY